MSERYERWLDEMAEEAQLPSEYRAEYRESLKGTLLGRRAELAFAVQDLVDSIVEACPRWLRRFVKWVCEARS